MLSETLSEVAKRQSEIYEVMTINRKIKVNLTSYYKVYQECAKHSAL